MRDRAVLCLPVAATEVRTPREQETVMAAQFELYKDKPEKFRFRLKAGNGEIIAVASEAYESKSSAKNGIESIKKNAATAEVVDET